MQPNNMRYIALLRGINVGGHNVKMEVVRKHFEELGFKNVSSYIQSGNIFFDSDNTNREKLTNLIETQLEKALGYAVPTCLRTVAEVKDVIALDPFKKITLKDSMRFSISFLREAPKEKLTLPYKTPDGGFEVVLQTETELFVVWYLKNGRPSNSYTHIEKKLGVSATVRFWHTTKKILDAAVKSS